MYTAYCSVLFNVNDMMPNAVSSDGTIVAHMNRAVIIQAPSISIAMMVAIQYPILFALFCGRTLWLLNAR